MSTFDKTDTLLRRLGDWMGESPSRWIATFTAGTILLFVIIGATVMLFVDGYELECPPGQTLQVSVNTFGKGTTRTYVCVEAR